MTDLKQTELFPTSLQVDSHAKTSASQGKEQGLQEKDQDCGGNFTASSRKSNRAGSLQKTSQPFALEDWIKFSGRSLRSGMMRNGIVYPLQPLAHLTAGTESGYWPTPRTRGLIGGSGSKAIMQSIVDKGILSSSEASAMSGLRLFPTPTSRDYKGLSGKGRQERKGNPADTLPNAIGGKLNPRWVEWLMGFSDGHTDLSS